MFRQKMFIKHKLFFYANKFSCLSEFSVKPFLSTRTTVLYLTRCTATVGSSELTNANVKNAREFPKPYFVQYMLDNSHEYSIFNVDQINVEDETNFKSLNLLKRFFDNSQETEMSADLLACLNEEFGTCSVDEICKFLILLVKYGNSTKLSKPLNLFSEILLKRKLSYEDTLKIMWVVRSLCVSRHRVEFKFFIKVTVKLCFKIHRLSSKQVVQFFLCMRKLPKEFLKKVKFPMQEKLVEIIPELNAEEFAIVANGITHSELSLTHFTLPFVVLNKATKEIENMNNILLPKICKLLELSVRHNHIKNLMDFQEKALLHISKFNEQNLIRLILTGSKLNCINPSLWETAADILKKNMENLKISDIERLLYAATMYNIHDEEFLSLAVQHVREKIDLQNHDALIKFLCLLVHHKLYPEDLLGLILSESFISQFDPEDFSIGLKHRYCFLNCCVELDKPKFNLHFLNQEQRKKLFRVFKIWSFCGASLIDSRSIIKKIMNILEDLYGENTVCESNCLPHYGNGIVMKFDRNLKAQTFESKFESHFYAKEAMNDNGLFSLFIMVLPKADFSGDGNTLVLPAQTQVRQLRGLGYKPVMLKSTEWQKHRKNGNEFNIIKELMQKNLEDLLQEK